MGVFHRATISPTKAELITTWAPTRPWGPPSEATLEVLGAFRFDDPENQVGIETHLVAADRRLFQVPLTYRDRPIAGAEDRLVGEMQHSALGTRWVYDGLGDDRYLMMLAAVALTGQGEALGMVGIDERWHVAPANVRIRGGGWTLERAPIDEFRPAVTDTADAVFRNDRFELTFFRHPIEGPHPTIGLTATFADRPGSVVLAEIHEL